MKVPVGHLPTVIFNKLATEYRRYQICGGMPEAASLMLDGAGMAENAVLQALLPQIGPDKPYYWTSGERYSSFLLISIVL